MALDNILNKVKINGDEYYRLTAPNDFYLPESIVKTLEEEFNPKLEKGGLIRFTYSLENDSPKFVAQDVVFVTNRSATPDCEYSPDKEELKKVYEDAFKEQLLPLAFHTHPTIKSEEQDIVRQGMNYLHQLNTSIADKGYTLRNNFTYKDLKLRLPDILVVVNSSAVFIGIYGGLIAPMCFTEQKEKASREGMEKVFEGVKNWANTPERKAVLVFSAIALVILGIRYYKVTIPTLIGAGIVVPPLLYSTQDRCDFFGVSYGLELKIHIPKIDDAEILEYEKKAIDAREEAVKKVEEKKKIRSASSKQ